MDIVSKIVGLVFLYAAVSKLITFPRLIDSMRDYKLLSGFVAPGAAALLIVSESLVALSHLTGFGLRYMAIGTIALLSVFLVISITLVMSGAARLPCLCFGASRDDYVDKITVVRIAILWVSEFVLCLGLQFVEPDQIQVEAETALVRFEEFFIAALIALLFSWIFLLNKLHRAWVIART